MSALLADARNFAIRGFVVLVDISDNPQDPENPRYIEGLHVIHVRVCPLEEKQGCDCRQIHDAVCADDVVKGMR